MLVFLVLGNVKVLSFALGDAKVPDANDFASPWNIGFRVKVHVTHPGPEGRNWGPRGSHTISPRISPRWN